MRIGIGLGVSQTASGGGGAVMPMLEWAFDDTSNLFQDTGGTTAVTTTSDPIGRVNSSGTNTFALTQPTAGNRPLWDGVNSATFDGTNDAIYGAGINSALTLSNMTIISTFRLAALPASTACIWAFSPGSGNGWLRFAITNLGRLRIDARTSANTAIASGDFFTEGIVADTDYTVSASFHDDVLDLYIGATQLTDPAGYAFDLATVDWYDANSNIAMGGRVTNALTTPAINDDLNGKVRAVTADSFA